MANNIEIKTKTFFQIPPDISRDHDFWPSRVVFMDKGFDINDIKYISSVDTIWELWFQFSVELYDGTKLFFDFKRKADCLMAQRELFRAWTRTGEFAYENNEDLDTGEG